MVVRPLVLKPLGGLINLIMLSRVTRMRRHHTIKRAQHLFRIIHRSSSNTINGSQQRRILSHRHQSKIRHQTKLIGRSRIKV